MLPRFLRLPGRIVGRVRQKGNKINLPSFYVKYLTTNRRSIRTAIVVSKKIDKRATQRNLIKRRVAHIIRDSAVNIHFAADIVISVKVGKTYEEYKKELEQWFAKLPSHP